MAIASRTDWSRQDLFTTLVHCNMGGSAICAALCHDCLDNVHIFRLGNSSSGGVRIDENDQY